MFSGILAEKIGRKKAAMTIGLSFTVGWALTVFASKVAVLYLARFIIGNL